jgi:hypothetical protein
MAYTKLFAEESTFNGESVMVMGMSSPISFGVRRSCLLALPAQAGAGGPPL